MKPMPSPPSVPDAARLAAPPPARLAHGLREFARSIRHIHDLNTFLEIFQVGLENTGLCRQADFRVSPPDATGHRPAAFAPGRMSVPVTAGGAVVTVGQVSPPADKQHFGPEDLQALAALSELVGAALDLAHQRQANERVVAALKAVLSFAPVGICAFDPEGRVIAANTLARGWLAVAEGDRITAALPAGTSLDQVRRGAAFHLRVSGRLLFCEARPQPDSRYVALVVTDLTPEQGRFLDALSREVFRANHLRRPLQFVLLERAEPMGALLASLPRLRAVLGRSAIAGPYDAGRVGLIFPEASWSAAVVQLRRIAADLVPERVRVGRSGLASFAETPEEIITAALAMPETLASILRPRILVQDEYRGVGDALRLVLGAACDVTGSTDVAEAHRLLEQQHFDAVLADLNPGAGGADLVATAKAHNQAVQAFFLSSTLPGARSGEPQAPGGVPVFSKPFDVERVRDRILASLALPHANSE